MSITLYLNITRHTFELHYTYITLHTVTFTLHFLSATIVSVILKTFAWEPVCPGPPVAELQYCRDAAPGSRGPVLHTDVVQRRSRGGSWDPGNSRALRQRWSQRREGRSRFRVQTLKHQTHLTRFVFQVGDISYFRKQSKLRFNVTKLRNRLRSHLST